MSDFYNSARTVAGKAVLICFCRRIYSRIICTVYIGSKRIFYEVIVGGTDLSVIQLIGHKNQCGGIIVPIIVLIDFDLYMKFIC